MKAKVVKEFYRIKAYGWMRRSSETVKEYKEYTSDMYYDAYKWAGKYRSPIDIERITVVEITPGECVEGLEWMTTPDMGGEIITGSVTVGPPHFAADKLGRYHPVNGWCIPEEIET